MVHCSTHRRAAQRRLQSLIVVSIFNNYLNENVKILIKLTYEKKAEETWSESYFSSKWRLSLSTKTYIKCPPWKTLGTMLRQGTIPALQGVLWAATAVSLLSPLPSCHGLNNILSKIHMLKFQPPGPQSDCIWGQDRSDKYLNKIR